MDRTGEINRNSQGLKMIIVNYRDCSHIDVQFDDGTIVKDRKYQCFKNGSISNPNRPSCYGVGFMGIGIYNSTGKNGERNNKCYRTWSHMIERCYSESFFTKHPEYKECLVDKEWHNFQNFAKWYYKNIWGDEKFLVLDKDWLIKSNKIYSSSTCLLVDNKINVLLTNRRNHRGECVIGVHRRNNKYWSGCSFGDGVVKWEGPFSTEFEAFTSYKKRKESYIKIVADEYNNKFNDFPISVYKAMYNYSVDIND